MFSKRPIKFKYRIIVGNTLACPYICQRKGLIFWHSIWEGNDINVARTFIRDLAHHVYQKPGTVLEEFNEKDYAIEKLKK